MSTAGNRFKRCIQILFPKHTLLLESLPQNEHFLVIDRQHCDRDPANLCQCFDLRAVPYEVFRPVVSPRIEQPNNLAVGIASRDVRTFESIAVDTSEGEIPIFRRATVLPRDDVIYLEWRRMKRRR